MGTNSFHLLVAKSNNSGVLEVLETHKEVVRLGEGFDAKMALSEDKICEAISALKRIKRAAEVYKPVFRVVATQAIRVAVNFQEIINRIKESTNLEMEVIDGIEEARLTFLGMRYCHNTKEDTILDIDIGGGSTEAIVSQEDKLIYLTSIKVGALTGYHKFLKSQHIKPNSIQELMADISTRTSPLYGEASKYNINKAFATSGTAKALAKIHHIQKYDTPLSQPNGYCFSTQDLEDLCSTLVSLRTPEKIRTAYKLDERRSEIILPGALILNQISKIFSVKEWHISTFGIREGIVLDTYSRMSYRLSEEASQQEKSILSIAQKLNLDLHYSYRLKSLSQDLFDLFDENTALLDIIPQKYKSKYRNLLGISAFLLEAGKFIGHKSYHKHTYYIISESSLLGFSREERHIIALINRFSRKKPANHGSSDTLPYMQNRIDIINSLSAILRITRCLFRLRKDKFETINIQEDKDEITLNIKVSSGEDYSIEKQSMSKETRHIQAIWNKKLRTNYY